MNYTYVLECSDGTFYTGWTTCLERRVMEHNSGTGAKYTKSRTPVKLIYYEEFETKQEAMRREAAIKKMTRREKEELTGSKKGYTSGQPEKIKKVIDKPGTVEYNKKAL